MGVLGVQRVGGDDRAGQVDAVQQGPEGGDLVALVGDLTLGQDVTGVVHRGEQGDVPGDGGCVSRAGPCRQQRSPAVRGRPGRRGR